MNTKNFNIRVYAIIYNDDETAILVADEYQKNMWMTKFPGGGLHYGEGTIECLQRETDEELNGRLTNIVHLYTTDFFQQDVFNRSSQLISIYYKAKLITNKTFPTSSTPLIPETKISNGFITFRWVLIAELNKKMFTFPIDQHVCDLIGMK
ncbi:MAG: NUDIX domain-containing protein [Bacteroidales bacterium]|nr:NUDIX domain-containing protein [Bacteroidales bacterium]